MPYGSSDLNCPNSRNIWLPELVERYAWYTGPNFVATTMCLVNKATAAQFRGRPEYHTVRLSEPVPPKVFEARWGSSEAIKELTLKQRHSLLTLTAASGVGANLTVALGVVGIWPSSCIDWFQIFDHAAAAGHTEILRLSSQYGNAAHLDSLTRAAAGAGQRHILEMLLRERHLSAFGEHHVGAALLGGHPELATWMLSTGGWDNLQSHSSSWRSSFTCSAAAGCNLPVLQELCQRCGFASGSSIFAEMLPSAIESMTADWKAKVEWVESRLPPGFDRRGAVSLEGAAQAPDAADRLAWLLGRGYAAGQDAVDDALCSGNAAALELLLKLLLRPSQQHQERAAAEGQLEALQKLYEYGVLVSPITIVQAAGAHSQIPILDWACDKLGVLFGPAKAPPWNISSSGFQSLQWLHSRRCQLDADKIALSAVKRADLPMLKWAVAELGASVSSLTLMDAAASKGCLSLLVWLREHGCPWGYHTFTSAVSAGCMAVLEWLVQQGCSMPVNGRPYVFAVHNHDEATLRYLVHLGCSWGPAQGRECVFRECLSGNASIPELQLLLDLGCPVDWDDWPWTELSISREVNDWIQAKRGDTAYESAGNE